MKNPLLKLGLPLCLVQATSACQWIECAKKISELPTQDLAKTAKAVIQAFDQGDGGAILTTALDFPKDLQAKNAACDGCTIVSLEMCGINDDKADNDGPLSRKCGAEAGVVKNAG